MSLRRTVADFLSLEAGASGVPTAIRAGALAATVLAATLGASPANAYCDEHCQNGHGDYYCTLHNQHSNGWDHSNQHTDGLCPL